LVVSITTKILNGLKILLKIEEEVQLMLESGLFLKLDAATTAEELADLIYSWLYDRYGSRIPTQLGDIKLRLIELGEIKPARIPDDLLPAYEPKPPGYVDPPTYTPKPSKVLTMRLADQTVVVVETFEDGTVVKTLYTLEGNSSKVMYTPDGRCLLIDEAGNIGHEVDYITKNQFDNYVGDVVPEGTRPVVKTPVAYELPTTVEILSDGSVKIRGMLSTTKTIELNSGGTLTIQEFADGTEVRTLTGTDGVPNRALYNARDGNLYAIDAQGNVGKQLPDYIKQTFENEVGTVTKPPVAQVTAVAETKLLSSTSKTLGNGDVVLTEVFDNGVTVKTLYGTDETVTIATIKDGVWRTGTTEASAEFKAKFGPETPPANPATAKSVSKVNVTLEDGSILTTETFDSGIVVKTRYFKSGEYVRVTIQDGVWWDGAAKATDDFKAKFSDTAGPELSKNAKDIKVAAGCTDAEAIAAEELAAKMVEEVVQTGRLTRIATAILESPAARLIFRLFRIAAKVLEPIGLVGQVGLMIYETINYFQVKKIQDDSPGTVEYNPNQDSQLIASYFGIRGNTFDGYIYHNNTSGNFTVLYHSVWYALPSFPDMAKFDNDYIQGALEEVMYWKTIAADPNFSLYPTEDHEFFFGTTGTYDSWYDSSPGARGGKTALCTDKHPLQHEIDGTFYSPTSGQMWDDGRKTGTCRVTGRILPITKPGYARYIDTSTLDSGKYEFLVNTTTKRAILGWVYVGTTFTVSGDQSYFSLVVNNVATYYDFNGTKISTPPGSSASSGASPYLHYVGTPLNPAYTTGRPDYDYIAGQIASYDSSAATQGQGVAAYNNLFGEQKTLVATYLLNVFGISYTASDTSNINIGGGIQSEVRAGVVYQEQQQSAFQAWLITNGKTVATGDALLQQIADFHCSTTSTLVGSATGYQFLPIPGMTFTSYNMRPEQLSLVLTKIRAEYPQYYDYLANGLPASQLHPMGYVAPLVTQNPNAPTHDYTPDLHAAGLDWTPGS
jgi:hypothetical protein